MVVLQLGLTVHNLMYQHIIQNYAINLFYSIKVSKILVINGKLSSIDTLTLRYQGQLF